jgi:hypothetical protein
MVIGVADFTAQVGKALLKYLDDDLGFFVGK